MEQEYYKLNIENWANSIVELEENDAYYEPPAEELFAPSSSLVSTMPTYYRSKVFTTHVGINPLINAADPILTLITKLRRMTIPPDIVFLHQNFCHEIKAFETKAETLGYRQPLIIAARYIICALLDEQLAITVWPDNEWRKYSFVDMFHKELWGEDRFFTILERSLQDATGHIDLLELLYICLRLGYEGKYRSIERGHLELRNITDNLYHVISQYREEISGDLLISLDDIKSRPLRKKSYFHLLPPLWLTGTLMMITVITVFSVLYFRLIEKAAPINQLLSGLQSSQEFKEVISTEK
jgi:type VI secretion system protein ImpK